MEKTSHSFETEAEARAFMAGFTIAFNQVHNNSVCIDPQDPVAVNADIHEDDTDLWYETFHNLKEDADAEE